MSLLNKSFDTISLEDLNLLIENQVLESKQLEYKEMLPGNSDSDKKEFLADVSAFANASGGHIIYGISERNGSLELCGLPDIDVDEEVRRLESIIQTGVDPRIPGVAIRGDIQVDGHPVILIHVPRSWASPHMVTFKGHSRFYSRNSAGKYPLDVSEIRAAFTSSEVAVERVRRFRTTRLSLIEAKEAPIPLNDGPKIVLHVIPLMFGSGSRVLDVSSIEAEYPVIAPRYPSSVIIRRFNLDGILFYLEHNQRQSYVQMFRDGCLEAVDNRIISNSDSEKIQIRNETFPCINIFLFENQIISTLEQYLSLHKQLGVELPLAVMLTLMSVKGFTIQLPPRMETLFDSYPETIDRDVLQIPEIIIDNYDDDPVVKLKPIFDVVWNAAGFAGSMLYNKDGSRTRR